MKHLLPAALLIASVVGMSSCTDPMPPPPPSPRGRSLDMPPRYGAGESQTRYFEGTEPPSVTADPNAAAATVQTPDPSAAPPPIPGTSSTTTTTTTIAPTPPVVNTPPPAPPTPAAADIPFATRMPGKPGFVKSPFDPNGQAIDVRDFQSGQKARCPYTGKIFRVP